jgi:hypothetical protein
MVLVICLTFIASVTAFASGNEATETNINASEPDTGVELTLDKIPSVIKEYVDAINNKDRNYFVKAYSPERQRFYVDFPSQNQI